MTIGVINKKAANNKISSIKIPRWQNIDTVLLDMDGTLLDLHFDNHFWLQYVPICFSEKHDLSHDEARRRIMQRYTEVRGSLDWYCVDFWSKELSLDIEQLKHDMAEKISIRPDVEGFLCWLNAHDKRVVLVTNAHPASLNLKMNKTKLHVHFDQIINAHAVGMAKEQEGFWAKLQHFETYDKRRTMLIDDNLEVLECADSYGIEYCYAIAKPDSRGDIIYSEKYNALDKFKDILP